VTEEQWRTCATDPIWLVIVILDRVGTGKLRVHFLRCNMTLSELGDLLQPFSPFVLVVPPLLWLWSDYRFGRTPSPPVTVRVIVLSSAFMKLKLGFFALGAFALSHKMVSHLSEDGSLLRFHDSCLLAFALQYLVRKTMPPTVMLLASSGPAGKGLLANLKLAIFPGRTAALLRSSIDSFAQNVIDVDHATESYISDDNFRTSGDDWQSVVQELLDFAPLIVLDARVVNPAVAWEVGHVMRSDLRRKVVVAADHCGATPALVAVLGAKWKDQYPAAVVRADDLVPYVRRVLGSRTPVPGEVPLPQPGKAKRRTRPRLAWFGTSRILNQLKKPRTTLDALHFISPMLPADKVELLLYGLRQHSHPQVRTNCIVSLQGYDLDDDQIADILGALRDDPSAEVRCAAASFLGIRGFRKRPVSAAIPLLVELMAGRNIPLPPSESFEDEILRHQLPMVVAAALQKTVGAETLLLEPGCFADPDRIRAQLEEFATGADAPAIRKDARAYLQHLFPAPEAASPVHEACPMWQCVKCNESNNDSCAVCRNCGTSKMEVMMLNAAIRAQSLMEAENAEEAVPLLREWEQLAEQIGDQRALAGCLCRQGEAQAWLGDPHLAQQLFQRAQSIYAKLREPGLAAIAVSHEANLTRHEFRNYRAAARLYERALVLARQAGRPDLMASIRSDLFECRSQTVGRVACLAMAILIALIGLGVMLIVRSRW